MTVFCPRHDLSAFVDGLTKTIEGHTFSVDDATSELHQEILQTEENFSRDPRTRFEQMRYVKSLNRLVDFLKTCTVPLDLTPRERLAIRSLRMHFGNALPAPLAAAFNQVTLTAGTFGATFDSRHRVAAQ